MSTSQNDTPEDYSYHKILTRRYALFKSLDLYMVNIYCVSFVLLEFFSSRKIIFHPYGYTGR